jgi:hypothetical protein
MTKITSWLMTRPDHIDMRCRTFNRFGGPVAETPLDGSNSRQLAAPKG